MVETRAAPRYRIMKAGKIEFGGFEVDCLVRNLSLTGAALEVSSQCGIPQEFNLVVRADGLNLPCHIVWRKDYRIGVAFD
jgi:PilZ domain